MIPRTEGVRTGADSAELWWLLSLVWTKRVWVCAFPLLTGGLMFTRLGWGLRKRSLPPPGTPRCTIRRTLHLPTLRGWSPTPGLGRDGVGWKTPHTSSPGQVPAEGLGCVARELSGEMVLGSEASGSRAEGEEAARRGQLAPGTCSGAGGRAGVQVELSPGGSA